MYKFWVYFVDFADHLIGVNEWILTEFNLKWPENNLEPTTYDDKGENSGIESKTGGPALHEEAGGRSVRLRLPGEAQRQEALLRAENDREVSNSRPKPGKTLRGT